KESKSSSCPVTNPLSSTLKVCSVFCRYLNQPMPETVSNPGRAPKRTATTRWRLYAALVVFAMLPLVLFLYVADWYLRRDFIRGLPPQTQRAAEIVGKLLDDKFTDVKSSLEAIAANPATFDAWDRGNSRIL